MTIEQKRKILVRIDELEHDIQELKRVRVELATSEYSSAQLSTTGGSKSYTRLDIDKITKLIYELRRELEQYQCLLMYGNRTPFKTIPTIWS